MPRVGVVATIRVTGGSGGIEREDMGGELERDIIIVVCLGELFLGSTSGASIFDLLAAFPFRESRIEKGLNLQNAKLMVQVEYTCH